MAPETDTETDAQDETNAGRLGGARFWIGAAVVLLVAAVLIRRR